MAIYFAFSDEAGEYQKNRNSNFTRRSPYFVRSLLLIQGHEWRHLQESFIRLKVQKGYPIDKEIKWSYMWSIFHHECKKEQIPGDRPYSFLSGRKSSDLLSFISSSLQLIENLDFRKIILTITDNSCCPQIEVDDLYRFHLQEHMQRVEMEIQEKIENLCVLFIDPVSNTVDQSLRNAYSSLFRSGDFIDNYRHIKDSLNMEYSHHSVGLQIADYIAGCTTGWLRNYQASKSMFKRYIQPNLRRSNNNYILGYGIREVPKYDPLRKEIQTRLV